MRRKMILSTTLTCLIFGQAALAGDLVDPDCYLRYKSQYDEENRDHAMPYFLKSSMYAGGSTLAVGASTLAGAVVLPAVGLGATGGAAVIAEWIIGSVVMGVPVAGVGYEIKKSSQISFDELKLRSWIYSSLNEEIGAGIIGANIINIHANLIAYMSIGDALENIRNADRLKSQVVTVEEVATALEQIASQGSLCEMNSEGQAISMSSGRTIFYALLSNIAKNKGEK